MARPLRPWAARAAAAALVLPALAGCRLVPAKVRNLEQLHGEDARHRYSAALMSDWEFGLRRGLAGLLPNARSQVEAKAPKKVGDPTEACLENLVGLAHFEAGDLRTSAVQVEWFARLARHDAWQLSRERCVLELAEAGARLGLEGPPAERTGPAASADEVAAALRDLIAGARPRLALPFAPPSESGAAPAPESPEPRVDLEEAVRRFSALDLDLEGALRGLRAAAALEAASDASDPRLEPLRALVVRLQRIAVREALRGAIRDEAPRPAAGSHPGWPSDRVRAAAIEANVELYGDPALAMFLDGLEREPGTLVVSRLLQLVRKRGLPERAPPGASEAIGELREKWARVIYARATLHPESRVRVAAMLALGTISRELGGPAVSSMREEDWQDWWRATHPELPPADGEGGGDGGGDVGGDVGGRAQRGAGVGAAP
ncbi:MAG TPA: hypothetical protein VMS76_06905 [Planctomycetota bacterium]|nr:hypothetical protein [Planctomycetota bacterium]